MSDHNPERVYDEAEISDILRLAGQMQAERTPEERHGLTLGDLKQIAREAGLDADLIEAAAYRLDEPDAEEPAFWEVRKRLAMHRTIPGRLSAEAWSQVVDEATRHFELVGASGQVGRAFEWTHTGERKHIQLRAAPEGTSTRVSLTADFKRLAPALGWVRALWALQAGLLAFGITAGAGAAGWPAGVVAVLAVAATMMATVFGFNRYVRRREAQAQQVLEVVDRLVTPAPKEAVAAAQAPAEHAPAAQAPAATEPATTERLAMEPPAGAAQPPEPSKRVLLPDPGDESPTDDGNTGARSSEGAERRRRNRAP